MNIRLFLGSERPILALVLLTLAPWVGVVLFSAGPWVALHTSGYALLVFAVGYAVVSTLLPAQNRSRALLLAPAFGVLLLSALTGFWVRLGLPLVWVLLPWIGLTAVGAMRWWWDRDLFNKTTVEYGGALVILSVVICAVYFIPGAFKDAISRADGSFNWIYVDTQYFQSIAANVKYCNGPPTMPGMATAQLHYHFGPYTPAAVISRVTGLDLGHALVRVTRGVEQWALVMSCFGLGTFLAVKATGSKFGGIMSVAGLFFYGSLLSLFADERNSASPVAGAVICIIPGIQVLANGGPFSHLILGHSALHGLVAITAIMWLCLLQREQAEFLSWRAFIFMALPALVIPVNSVASLYCLGIVSILLLWRHLTNIRSWLAILLMFGLFAAGWRLMGFSQASDATVALISKHPDHELWWTVGVWLTVGLGFRIEGFRWISKPWEDPVSALFLASLIGLPAFFIFVHLDGNERYGIYFLQSVFSIFAFSRLEPGFYRSSQRDKWISNLLGLTMWVMMLIILVGGIIGVYDYVLHGRGHSGIPFLRFKLLSAILVFLSLTVLSVLIKRGGILSTMSTAFLSTILLFGCLAWIEPWLNFGLGRQKMDVTLTNGEVEGLKRLNWLASPGERFATNKHALDSLALDQERSFAYDTISERPVLLEGYLYRDVTALPGFKDRLRDNDLMFTTTNPETLQDLAASSHVRWLVARPGTDIALQHPLPRWLDEETNCGSLRIYRIN